MSLAAALAAVLLTATPASSSHLGLVVLGADASTTALLAACPRLVVVPLPADGVTELDSAVGNAVKAYRTNCSGTFVVVQVGGDALQVDASTAAAFYTDWIAQVKGAQLFFQVDAIEGPSEPTATTTDNLVQFWSSFAVLVHGGGGGLLPIVGSLAPGLPADAGTSSDVFCQVASQVKSAVGGSASYGWSYHARSVAMSMDPATEAATTLGYRQITSDCGLSSPLYLTQAGPSARAWTSADLSWAEWLDGEVKQDADVVGAALFETGGADAFTLTPLASGLAAYLSNPSASDGGTDGGSDGGTGSRIGTSGGPGSLGTPKMGCAVGGAGLVALLVLPLLLVRRRRSRY